GLPYIYRPPESLELKDDEFIDGRYFDLWSYGIMAFELLNAFHIARSHGYRYLCKEARYASLKFALQGNAEIIAQVYTSVKNFNRFQRLKLMYNIARK
ncbi:hypothetical protein AVEN_180466-1, partial [Araneus ventricosus]